MTFDLEKEIIKRLNRKWTFGEIQNMKETCVGIANAIAFEMPSYSLDPQPNTSFPVLI